MPQYIANPIYDTAFKYMMQNERAAKVLISNLLDKEVDELQILANDIPVFEKDSLRILRLDFAAKIRDRNTDRTEIVTIELQKAYSDSEVKRFRDYLASNYANPRHTEKRRRMTVAKNRETGKYERVEVEEDVPLHIIAIYFLGSGFDDLIDSVAPVIYNFPQPVGIDGQPVKGIRDTLFFKALTHDTIVVRINKLKANAQSKVEKMLEIFIQDDVSDSSKQLLEVKDIDTKSDEYRELAMPLALAAGDVEFRKKMSMEAYLSRLLQDSEYAQNEKEYYQQLVSEQASQLQEQKTQLQEKDSQLQEKDALIAEYQKLLASAGIIKK